MQVANSEFHFRETTEQQAQHIEVEHAGGIGGIQVADKKEQTEELRTNLRHQKKKSQLHLTTQWTEAETLPASHSV